MVIIPGQSVQRVVILARLSILALPITEVVYAVHFVRTLGQVVTIVPPICCHIVNHLIIVVVVIAAAASSIGGGIRCNGLADLVRIRMIESAYAAKLAGAMLEIVGAGWFTWTHRGLVG